MPANSFSALIDLNATFGALFIGFGVSCVSVVFPARPRLRQG